MKKLENRYTAGLLTGIISTLAVFVLGFAMYFAVSGASADYFPNGMVKYATVRKAAATIAEAKTEIREREKQGEKRSADIEGVTGVTDSSDYSLAARRLFDGKLTMLLDRIDEYYVESIDKDALYEAMLHTLVDTLHDPYSCYYSASEYEDIAINSAGSFCGIGATVTQDINTLDIIVVSPYAGSPAEKAGILPGDRIVKVDDTDVVGTDLNLVVSMMRGVKGTPVEVTVIRDGATVVLHVIRDDVEIPSVEYEMLEDGIGYIEVSSFTEVTSTQFDKAIAQLQNLGMDRLVIDLRNNGGGLMDTCVAMLDRIVEPGKLLVYTKDKYGSREDTVSYTKETLDMPIAILCNGNSASASEVFMGALKSYGLVTIVGTRSFGKGVVQAIVPIGIDNSALRITGWKYYTPDGVCIHGIGITPDIEVAYEPAAEGELYDSQLKAAIDVLKD